MVSMTPHDHIAALTADAKPLLVIVGEKDEAFHAERFAAVVGLHEHGDTLVIDGESHDSVLRSAASLKAVAGWVEGQWPGTGAHRPLQPSLSASTTR
jgi:hypothetical protein